MPSGLDFHTKMRNTCVLSASTTIQGIKRNLTYRMSNNLEFSGEMTEAERNLESLNDELENFAYAVSHDLQEPIRVIHSYALLLKNRNHLSTEGSQYLEAIIDCSKRMQVFVANLLQHAQTGQKVDEDVLPTNEVMQMVLQNLAIAIEESNAEIECDALLNVNVDYVNLIQIFQNLISNSLKFRKPNRAPKIRITSKLLYNYVQFAVTDNGIGINHKYKDFLFLMFQRLPTKGVYKGNGIGLATVKKILDSYGGRINVASEDGEGTTVYFTLPKGDI